MKALIIGVAAAVVLLVAPSTGTAQNKLPVGKAHGVSIVREQGALVVVFTQRAAKLYKRIAGRLVDVECTDWQPRERRPRAETFIGPHHPGGLVTGDSGGVTMRAPKHRRKLVTGDLTRGMDYCRVWLPARTVGRHDRRVRIARRLIVSVPLTQSGAVLLDEESKARQLQLLLIAAGFVAEDLGITGWPSHTQLVAQADPKKRNRLVRLASPADTPPAGTIGYFSDRHEHVAVVTLSKSGRRLFIEGAGDVLTTNVAGYTF